MQQSDPVLIRGKDGLSGSLETSLLLGGNEPQVLLRLSDGHQVLLPSDLLQPQEDGSYYLPLTVDEAEQRSSAEEPEGFAIGDASGPSSTLADPERAIEGSIVEVTKVVYEQERVVNESLLADEVTVRRVPVNQFVNGPVLVRHVNDTVIVPLVEEVLVVEKRLLLREELHITKRQVARRQTQRFVVRSEDAIIEQVNALAQNLGDDLQ